MIEAKNLKPFPGFVILEPYELKNKKTGAFTIPQEEGENTPQIGKIITIGKYNADQFIKSKKIGNMADSQACYPFEVGKVVAYKKYQDFPIQIGTKKYIAVAFEHLLFEIEDN